MADLDVVAFNSGAFISSIFLLEFGADKLITHAATLAQLTGVPTSVIGLLTAGAEWEELAVVVASLAHGRHSLAIGNVIGAAISNILGAFSLGLLFHARGEAIEFDKSSRLYSLLLLVLTTASIPAIYARERIVWLVSGTILIFAFGVYVIVVTAAIARGLLVAPEDSDDDDDGDVSDEGSVAGSTTALLDHDTDEVVAARGAQRGRKIRSHGGLVLLGFIATTIAGYVLSQASVNITNQLGMSDVLFGVSILSVATTLPEKFIAVASAYRGHPGILVANCAGSNIFLMALCLGIIMVANEGNIDDGSVTIFELLVLWVSTAVFTLTIWAGARAARLIGILMLVGYVTFIALEFTVIHRK